MDRLTVDTPTGPLTLLADDHALTRITWRPQPGPDHPSPLLRKAAQQLTEYFDGTRTQFDLPLRVDGSPLTRAVCDQILKISYGETSTYGAIGHRLGAPAQAVGQACGSNPIPLVIPCHRVLAASGLGGFSGEGGIETKVQLLKLERAASLML